MGFFSKFTATVAFDSVLKQYRVNIYSLPMTFSSMVIRETTERHEQSLMLRSIPLEFCLQQSAALVALCVLGPTKYEAYGEGYGVSMTETVADAARIWRERGPSANVETRIIQAISDASLLHSEFADAFNAMIRQSGNS